jgi:Threonine synthase
MSDPEVQASLQGVTLSSANSINIGRLVPQIVYYYSSYAKLVNDKVIACGDKVNFVVPTGNFGDILAGYMAECLGLPVGRLICASNTNNVLTDFLKTGVYSIKRPFHTTIIATMKQKQSQKQCRKQASPEIHITNTRTMSFPRIRLPSADTSCYH